MLLETNGKSDICAVIAAPKPGKAMPASMGWSGAASRKNPAAESRCAKWCEATLCGAP